MLDFPPLYLKNLHLKNIRAFKGEFSIDLSDGKGKPAQWSVILGNNNTGKTTVLRAIADLEPKVIPVVSKEEEVEDWITCNYQLKLFKKSYDYDILKQGNLSTRNLKISREISCGFIMREDLDEKLSISNYNNYNLNYDSTFDTPFINPKSLRGQWGITNIGNRFSITTQRTAYYAELIALKFIGYGPSRRIIPVSLQRNEDNEDTTISLFQDVELLNIEGWLLQIDYAQKNKSKEAIWRLKHIKDVLFNSNILPDVNDLRFTTDNELRSFVEVQVKSDWIKLSEWTCYI